MVRCPSLIYCVCPESRCTDENKYILKTVPFEINIVNILNFMEYIADFKNWFADVGCGLSKLEGKNVASDNFIKQVTDPIDFASEFDDIPLKL